MAKKVKAIVKLHVPAGKANPAPPVGPALGQHGVNIMEFCKAFNNKTSAQVGDIIPAQIPVYQAGSFTFITKTPPVSSLLKRAAGLEKASGVPNKQKVGQVTEAQVRDIAERKLPDLNARDLESAIAIVKGTAQSMGIEVVG